MPLSAVTLKRCLISPLSWKSYRRALREKQLAVLKGSNPDLALRDNDSSNNSSPSKLLPLRERRIDNTAKQRSKINEDVGATHLDHSGATDRGSADTADIASSDFWMVSVPSDDEEDGIFHDSEDEQWEGKGGELEGLGGDSVGEDKEDNCAAQSVDVNHAAGTASNESVSTSNHVTPFEDASEPLRLQYMSSYLDLAAREILSRATQSQRFSLELHQQSLAPTHGPRSKALSLCLSRVTCTPSSGATGLSEHMAHSLLVPNQKYSVGITPASAASIPPSNQGPSLPSSSFMQLLSEIDRDIAVQVTRSESKVFGRDGASSLSEAALHSLFGVRSGDLHGYPHSYLFAGALPRGRTTFPSSIVPRTSNINNTVTSASQPLEGEGEGVVEEGQRLREEMDKEKKRLGPLVVMDATGGREGDIYTDFTASITQKLRALQIPPLPPALGSLQYNDEKSHTSYLKSLEATPSSNTFQPQSREVQLSTATTSSSMKKTGLSHPPHPKGRSSTATPVLPTLTLMSNIREHLGPVHRLAVSPDQSYFASASADSTVKIWQLRGLDNAAFPRSSVTYTGHLDGVTDLCVIENSHSVVSASLDGQLHVWRVDLASDKGPQRGSDIGKNTDFYLHLYEDEYCVRIL
jgi:WD40 repeat protein